MRKVLEALTYRDLAGRRRPRRYFMAAIVILGLVLPILGWSLFQRWQARAQIFATPQPTRDSPATSQTDLTLSVVGQPAAAQTPLSAAAGEQAQLTASVPEDGCPTSSEAWVFLDVLPGDNYKQIEPTCVYEGLARTVAWHFAERLGYSKPEAAELLSFADLPWQPASTIIALTNTQEPQELALTIEWPAHLEYRYWVVDAAGEPIPIYSLRGCYRTRTVRGAQAERWNPDFAALCVVAVDYAPGWALHELGTQRYAQDNTAQPGSRAFLLFGYTADLRWVFSGERQDQHVSIEDAAQLRADREHITAKYGAEVWDAAWLRRTFGLAMQSLPEGWQLATDPAALELIVAQMNAFIKP